MTAPVLTLETAMVCVQTILARRGHYAEIAGARWTVVQDGHGAPMADQSLAIVEICDGSQWRVERDGPFGPLKAAPLAEITYRGVDWDLGYQAGFADGANDESSIVREAAQAALFWLEAEAAKPGETRPDEILRVLREALGERAP